MDVSVIKYVICGKIGDLLHAIYVIACVWKMTGKKGVLYLSDNVHKYGGDNFAHSLSSTFQDLKSLIMSQPYIRDFILCEDIDLNKDFINLNTWRKYSGQLNWYDNLKLTYSLSSNHPFHQGWLSYSFKKSNENEYIAIHRSLHRHNPQFPWEYIIRRNTCVFVTSDEKEAECFPWISLVDTVCVVKTLDEMARIINGSNYFIGNQSAPCALAMSLGKPCYVELYPLDAISYIGLPWNVSWFLNNSIGGRYEHRGLHEHVLIPFSNNHNILSVPVSIGEALDKLSILDIKLSLIKDQGKLDEIQKEHDSLSPLVTKYIKLVNNQYSALVKVNKRIWDLVDISRYSKSAVQDIDVVLMKENDARYRIKKKINLLTGSALSEQKSQDENASISICSNDMDEIRELAIYNDKIIVHTNALDLKKLLKDDPFITVINQSEKHIVFLNCKKSRQGGICSIYESGLQVYNALKSKFNIRYIEDIKANSAPIDILLVNYHHSIHKVEIAAHNKPLCIAMVLEVPLHSNDLTDYSHKSYDKHMIMDPSFTTLNSSIYSFPRPLLPFDCTLSNQTNIPLIGSFGLATMGKRWDLIVEQVNKEYDRAIIRFNIPFASHVPNYQNNIDAVIKSIKPKKGIEVRITHDQMTQEELIKWCSENTINVFFYFREKELVSGLAAVTDQAIAAGKPILITADKTFRHVHAYLDRPDDVYPNIGIREAIERTQSPVLRMKEAWSITAFAKTFGEMISKSNV